MSLKEVQERISRVAARNGRSPSSVKLLAVSKTHDASTIVDKAIGFGHRLFAENRVQEAERKWPQIREQYPDCCLHLVGKLQTNKVKQAFRLFQAIQSLDRERLAEKIANEAQRQGFCPELFVQVNTGEEPQKSGVIPDAVDEFIEKCVRVYQLPVVGLMSIPPFSENPSPHFALLAAIGKRNALPELSMGMSKDFAEAIVLGATYVRVGTAIFGDRKPGNTRQ